MSEIKMLPLPASSFQLRHDDATGTEIAPPTPFWNARKMQSYARAVAEHNVAARDAEIEALRAEVERLQKIVRPKREEECLTLDHWRMRAYDLEANWSRCSRACAGEQGKREQAEARAERLAEALQGLRDLMLGQVKWMPCDCGCPQQRTPDGPHSVTWLRAAQQVEIAISKAEGKE